MNEADYLGRQMTLFPICSMPQKENTRNTLSGKTFLEHFQATKGVTFKPCLAKSHKSIFQCLSLEDGQEAEWYEAKDVTSHGASLTLNIGASPTRNQGGICISVFDMTHAQDVIRERNDGTVQTLNNRMGTGGNQVPIIYTFNRDASIKNNMPIYEDKTSTLKSSTRLAVVYAIDRAEFNQGANAKYDFKISDNGINSTLVARGPSAVGCIYKNIDCSYVRRLTPLECERLQGLPDNWTEGGSDTARYRAIGNGMAQPCADYVMSKVVEDVKGGSICDL